LIEFVGHEGDDDGDDEDYGETKLSMNLRGKEIRGTGALLLDSAFDLVCGFLDTGYGISALACQNCVEI